MPRYTTRRKKQKKNAQKRIQKALPRDRRKLLRWAVRQGPRDYEWLRRTARRVLDTTDVPAYIDKDALESIASADKPSMVKAILGQGAVDYDVPAFNFQSQDMAQAQADQVRTARHRVGGWVGHAITDGLSWLLDKANPKGLNPLANLAQQGLKAFRGENLNEQDEIYAKIVDDSYLAERPDRIEDYVRVPEFDSEYVSLWETSEGHRFIAVRGTKPTHMRDLAYDAEIAAFGRIQHDVVGAQLQRILDSTSPGVTVDVGGHSLGTALILRSYKENADMQNRIQQTYLYNPAYNPTGYLTTMAKDDITEFEKDQRVRYFINLADGVSIGGLGHTGPANVVYKTPIGSGTGLNVHKLRQWQGHYGHEKKAPEPAHREPAQVPQVDVPVAEMQGTFEPNYYIYKDDVASDLPQPADNLDVIDFGVDPFLEDFHRERVYAHKGQSPS